MARSACACTVKPTRAQAARMSWDAQSWEACGAISLLFNIKLEPRRDAPWLPMGSLARKGGAANTVDCHIEVRSHEGASCPEAASAQRDLPAPAQQKPPRDRDAWMIRGAQPWDAHRVHILFFNNKLEPRRGVPWLPVGSCARKAGAANTVDCHIEMHSHEGASCPEAASARRDLPAPAQ